MTGPLENQKRVWEIDWGGSVASTVKEVQDLLVRVVGAQLSSHWAHRQPEIKWADN